MATWKIHTGPEARQVVLGDFEAEILERGISAYLREHSGFIVRGAFSDSEPGTMTSLWIHASTPQSFVYRAVEDREEVEKLAAGIVKTLQTLGRIDLPDMSGPPSTAG